MERKRREEIEGKKVQRKERRKRRREGRKEEINEKK